MADETPINPVPGAGPDDQPQAATISQYIKDLSVESPNSPLVFQWNVQPQVEVQFNINVDSVAEDVHEVVLRVNVSAKSDQGTHFLVDLSYAGLFGLRNFPGEAMAPFMLVEAPQLIFPFARQVIAEAVQNAGFPPLLLEPIDFGRAFMTQMEQQQAEGGALTNGSGEAGNAPAEAVPSDPTPTGE
jgi:preprotein translocase subunit SecB